MTFAPFTVYVPATSANLGPGFDTLGMAVDIVNTVRVEPSPQWEISLVGEGADRLPTGDRNVLYRTVMQAARRWGVELPTAKLRCEHTVPLARGLGSSSATIVAGLLIADRLGKAGRTTDDLLAFGAELEGHPDNVTPALLGGVQACALVDGRVVHAQVPLPRALTLALYVPDLHMPTREARQVVPRKLDIHDAVYNLSRACLLVTALASGDLDVLKVATEDMIHQPARARLFPSMPVLFHAALAAGALGVYLSGAGSTIAAFVSGGSADAQRVADAMADAASRDGLTGRPMVASVREQGATIEEI
ncbi:MAG TPA: homoserine kinase [Chloroflexota bacterium]